MADAKITELTELNAAPADDDLLPIVDVSETPDVTKKILVKNLLSSISLTSGETINGATLPVAVYQDTSNNKIYACDGNNTAKLNFIGFAISNSTDGNPINIKFNGIVGGFTGLTEGANYYVKDDQTIGTTPGTYEIFVGVAISETQLLIRTRMNSKILVDRNSNQSITNGSYNKVQFNNVVFDGRGEYDASINYRFTASEAGYYQINAKVTVYEVAANGTLIISLYKNGTEVYSNMNANGANAVSLGSNISVVMKLAANDYIEIYGKPSSSAQIILGSGVERSYLSIHRLS